LTSGRKRGFLERWRRRRQDRARRLAERVFGHQPRRQPVAEHPGAADAQRAA
jgi:hypothetical protein